MLPQTPRYDSLKTVLSSILRYFLTLDVSEPTNETTPPQGAGAEGGGAGETTPPCGVLEIRKCKLQEYLDNLTRNKEDLVNLVTHGYSTQLWDKVRVTTVLNLCAGKKS